MSNQVINNTSSPFLSSVGADQAAIAFTELKWPNNPFHSGEILLQQAAGVQENVMSYAPTFVRNKMPDQHREFFAGLPFLAVAARDKTGAMWSTLLEKHGSDSGTAHFITSPSHEVLHIWARPVPGDALHDAFSFNTATDLGILGIQLETKRRNRVNGSASLDPSGGIKCHIDQSFGNCPQYIKPRDNWYRAVGVNSTTASPDKENSTVNQSFTGHLTDDQIRLIHSAETIFTASGYRGQGQDVRFGNDASHRGGSPGFVRAVEMGTDNNGVVRHAIEWTEYPGNNHFNTLGNIVMDPRVGISIPDFATGGLLQISGTAVVEMGKLEDGGRKVHMEISAVNELPAGSLPIRWPTEQNAQQEKKHQPLFVSRVVQESEDVKSFYLEPADPFHTLPDFRAGQHLPIELTVNNGQLLKRTYSLSSAPKGTGFYRISVKKAPFGAASTFLHNHIKVGDTLSVGHPAGDFVRALAKGKNHKTTVLLSAGIGVTPMLSMLHEIVSEQRNDSEETVVWMHGAHSGRHHVFQEEVRTLLLNNKKSNNQSIESHIFYSQPDPATDCDTDSIYHKGRISAEAVQRLVPSWKNAVYFMCGPPAFLADLQSGLEHIGVNLGNIYFETF